MPCEIISSVGCFMACDIGSLLVCKSTACIAFAFAMVPGGSADSDSDWCRQQLRIPVEVVGSPQTVVLAARFKFSAATEDVLAGCQQWIGSPIEVATRPPDAKRHSIVAAAAAEP